MPPAEYQMQDEHGERFKAAISRFYLVAPGDEQVRG